MRELLSNGRRERVRVLGKASWSRFLPLRHPQLRLLVSMPKPRMAFTSTGCLPRMAGRNFQLGRAAITLAVIAAGPGLSTRRFFRFPEASSAHEITRRACGRPEGRSERIACGPVIVPANGCEAEVGSANCITTVPAEVST